MFENMRIKCRCDKKILNGLHMYDPILWKEMEVKANDLSKFGNEWST